MNRYRMVLEGPETVQAGEGVRDLVQARKEWPYPWSFAPPGAIRVTAGADTTGTLVVPVAGTPTEGLAFTVAQDYHFALEKIVVTYIGGAAAPGDFLWSLTVNRPVGLGTFQGSAVQGFTAVDVGLGSLVFPWPLECPEIFEPNDCIRVVFTNVNVPDGVGNYFKSIFLGWRWPVR